MYRLSGRQILVIALGSALFAAIALSGVAAAVPITFILLPGLRGLVAPARVGDALLGLILMAPATVGFAVALSGLGPVSRSLSAASRPFFPSWSASSRETSMRSNGWFALISFFISASIFSKSSGEMRCGRWTS